MKTKGGDKGKVRVTFTGKQARKLIRLAKRFCFEHEDQLPVADVNGRAKLRKQHNLYTGWFQDVDHELARAKSPHRHDDDWQQLDQEVDAE